MLDLSAAAILEKNKLASDGAWLVLLKIVAKQNPTEPIYLVRNRDKITWNGAEWIPFPFDMDDINDDGQGEIQSLTVKVSNVTRVIQGYIEELSGGVDATVTVLVVNSNHLDVTAPSVEEEFSVTGTSCDDQWVYFSLGPAYPVSSRRPERRYLKNFCQFEYCGIECGLPESIKAQAPTCDKTLISCKNRGNSHRYNGEPSIQGGIYV